MKNHLKHIRHFFSSSICVLTVLLLITSCYHQKPETHDAMVTYSAKQIDSLSFQAKHHYTNNYNFIVKADSTHSPATRGGFGPFTYGYNLCLQA